MPQLRRIFTERPKNIRENPYPQRHRRAKSAEIRTLSVIGVLKSAEIRTLSVIGVLKSAEIRTICVICVQKVPKSVPSAAGRSSKGHSLDNLYDLCEFCGY